MTPLMWALAVVAVVNTVLLVVLLLRRAADPAERLGARFDAIDRAAERLDRALHEEMGLSRKESAEVGRGLRDEVTTSLTRLSDGTVKQLEAVRAVIEQRLQALQADNAQKLESMRQTVDEKLQGTLERRLTESFKLVSQSLEQVQKGLGEMQTLASGVGDLKKVLTNVKTRGTWGEIQLGALLEDCLSPVQYAANVATRGEGEERVEFAIRLPGRADDEAGTMWLPIDAKFPQEDYLRLLEAQEAGDLAGMEAASKQLEVRIRGCARDICEKYVAPPSTTDFGIMFLPTEGLYAEVLRRPGLAELLRREYQVVITGPTTLWAVLNALQMGFRTLAIQERSSEVWGVLGSVKTEFEKFGDVLLRIKKKLEEASNVVEQASRRSRVLQRKLKDVEALPAADGSAPALPAALDAEEVLELVSEGAD
jgi:DNA recombination protein RmuC